MFRSPFQPIWIWDITGLSLENHYIASEQRQRHEKAKDHYY